MEATIDVAGLRKRFGPTTALDGMSFTVQPGQVTGFVGPNGAGKSTTMRVILGLDAADEGKATVGGTSYASLRQPMRTSAPMASSRTSTQRCGTRRVMKTIRVLRSSDCQRSSQASG